MARAGLLHVTVITATLLRDSGGSDSEPADTYASVGCGKQNFTTNTVKNHRTKPAWNESHTFRFEEKAELESQHILIEIFAERPKLDELLGLAKIPLHKVIAVGDEISTHSLNRPDEDYIGHEQYSGHVKVALRWDSAQAVSAYPQTYTPAARYNPSASTAKGRGLSRQSSRSGEQLRTGTSAQELLHHQEEDCQERRVHHRSSSCPSRSYIFCSSAPSPSESPWKQPPASDSCFSTAQNPSNISPRGAPSTGSSSCHASAGAGPSSQGYVNGCTPCSHVPYAGPHVPYVPHEVSFRAGTRAVKGLPGNGHLAYQMPTQTDPDPALQEDPAKSKLSKSKQAEMAKLAELSRLTEVAKIQATGFAKAGQQPSPWGNTQRSAKQNYIDAVQQPDQSPSVQKGNDVQGMQQNNVPQRPRINEAQPHHQQLINVHKTPETKVESQQQLAVVSTVLDIVQAEPSQEPQKEKHLPLLTTSQRPPDVFYEKSIQKVERLEKKKGSPFQQTWKMLRRASKIFGT